MNFEIKVNSVLNDDWYFIIVTKDNVAEWSKALASGASPQGRGFESRRYHFYFITISFLSK